MKALNTIAAGLAATMLATIISGKPSMAAAKPQASTHIMATTLTPPFRLPQPRPDYFDMIVDVRSMLAADRLDETDPDDGGAGTIPHRDRLQADIDPAGERITAGLNRIGSADHP